MTRESVTRTQQQMPTTHPLSSGILQRKCKSCGQHAITSGECQTCKKKGKTLQRRAMMIRSEPDPVPTIVQEVLNSSGQPLAPKTRKFMESRFRSDFSQVRVHTDTKAAESARSVNSLAYTVRHNIVFGTNQYVPSTPAGARLLAHELAHVIQQRHAAQQKLKIGTPNDSSEHEADRIADVVVTGRGQIDKSPIQRTSSLQRACGPAEIGTVNTCTGLSGDVSGTTFRFVVNCDDFQAIETSNLRAFASTVASSDVVEVHGFASEEGPAGFNDNLSCARAEKASQVLIDAGVNFSHIRLFRHGATAGRRAERRSVVVNKTPITCGPDATDWYVRQVNTASTDPAVLGIQTELATADRIARSNGTTVQQVTEGALTGRVVLEESNLGARAPARNLTITGQLVAGTAAGVASASALSSSTIDAISIGGHLRTAANEWRNLVNHGARYDFKAHTMRRPSTANCPSSACRDSITLCPGSAPENCYLTDLPGNLFYAQIGRFVGWSELTLQLGSQLAQLTGTASWDPPQDTAAIHLGFLLPVPMTTSDLCRTLPAARSTINNVPNCGDCTELTTAVIR